ncbi:MAG: hypothetical protein JST64_09950 [Actinobacteria bacterium]|nr:hypothetical protein [Actinomycetota bacterium]
MSTPSQVCDLLTPSEISAALGTAPTTPPRTNTAQECDYASPSNYNFVTISVRSNEASQFWEQDAARAGATATVEGLGERAWATPDGAPAGTIVVFKGDTELRIDVGQPADQVVLKNLATTASGRM